MLGAWVLRARLLFLELPALRHLGGESGVGRPRGEPGGGSPTVSLLSPSSRGPVGAVPALCPSLRPCPLLQSLVGRGREGWGWRAWFLLRLYLPGPRPTQAESGPGGSQGGGRFPRASPGGVHIPHKQGASGFGQARCSGPRPGPRPPAQRCGLGLVWTLPGSRLERGVGTACLAHPCWEGCRLARGKPAGAPAPTMAWAAGGPTACPSSRPPCPLCLESWRLRLTPVCGLGLGLSRGSASTGGKSKGCSDSWGGGEGLQGQEAAGGGHFLFVAPQSLEEAFVLISLET